MDRTQISCIHSDINLLNISNEIKELIVISNTGTANYIQEWNLSPYKQLHSIIIGNYCFINLTSFIIQDLTVLEKLVIGNNNFSKSQELDYYYCKPCAQNASFKCVNNTALKEIQIGTYSFNNYSNCIIESKSILFHVIIRFIFSSKD